MILRIGSSKGSPGATSAALALAAAWPHRVVLVEADPSGGDLALRCTSAAGGPLAVSPSVLSLAAAARSDSRNDLSLFSQELACGVSLVQGVTTPAQGRGLAELWPKIIQSMRTAGIDVIIDLGRLDPANPSMAPAKVSDRVLITHTSSMDSVMHARETLLDLNPGTGPSGIAAQVMPLIVGPARHAASDRRDVDRIFSAAGLSVAPAAHLPLDRPTLDRLQSGEHARGRLSRTMLLRSASDLARQLTSKTAAEVLA